HSTLRYSIRKGANYSAGNRSFGRSYSQSSRALKNTYDRVLARHHNIFYRFGPLLMGLQRIICLLRGTGLSLWRCPAMSSFMKAKFDKYLRGALMTAQGRVFWL
ncbi:MAG: hypothetical protein CML59_05000, partial [Rhodobacteraceae bacterium]|nr:hypothetical protein [Paracoccaceae bacterium]